MGKKSNSSSTQQQNLTDNRSITTIDDRDTTQNYNYQDNDSTAYSYADNSMQLTDASSSYSYADNSFRMDVSDDRDYFGFSSDNSNRSTNTTNISTSDPGAVRLGELNSQLLGMVAETQTDAVKAVAQFGAKGFSDLGESVTNLYSVAGQNAGKAWSETLSASGELIDKLVTSANRTTDAARSVAQSAVASYQPIESKNAEALKWGAIAAAVVGGLYLMRKA